DSGRSLSRHDDQYACGRSCDGGLARVRRGGIREVVEKRRPAEGGGRCELLVLAFCFLRELSRRRDEDTEAARLRRLISIAGDRNRDRIRDRFSQAGGGCGETGIARHAGHVVGDESEIELPTGIDEGLAAKWRRLVSRTSSDQAQAREAIPLARIDVAP